MIKNLVILFILTTLSNAIATLKNMFIIKKQSKPAYIATFVDAIVFGTIMKRISDGENVFFILAFAFGKVVGVWLGKIIENKIALGILEIEVFVNKKEAMINIADELRDLGYSVETTISYGYKGRKRYIIGITALRKELDNVKEVVIANGYKKPTMKIKEIAKVSGKFSLTSKKL